MYGKSLYPFQSGDLVSPFFSHGQLSCATSTSLIDFSCRNTWVFPDMERPLYQTGSYNMARASPTEFLTDENQPKQLRRFKPTVIYPPCHYPDDYRYALPSMPGLEHFPKFQWFETKSSKLHSTSLSFAKESQNEIHRTYFEVPAKSSQYFTGVREDYAVTKANIHDPADDRNHVTRHLCPFCHVTCSNNGQMKGHMRVHTGERPYRCDHAGCNKAFVRNEELTRHKRIHSGIKPYTCEQCEKRFGRKDHLNKHRKTHLRAKDKTSYACLFPGCRQIFTRSDALARHRHHGHGQQKYFKKENRVT